MTDKQRLRASALPNTPAEQAVTTSTADKGMRLDVAGRGEVTLRPLSTLTIEERDRLADLVRAPDKDTEWAAQLLRLLATWWSFPLPLPSSTNKATLDRLAADVADALVAVLCYASEGYDAGLLQQRRQAAEQRAALKADGVRRLVVPLPEPDRSVWLARAFLRGNEATRRCLTRNVRAQSTTKADRPAPGTGAFREWAVAVVMADRERRLALAARTKATKAEVLHPTDTVAVQAYVAAAVEAATSDLKQRIAAVEADQRRTPPLGPLVQRRKPSAVPSRLSKTAAEYVAAAAATTDAVLAEGYRGLAKVARDNEERHRR